MTSSRDWKQDFNHLDPNFEPIMWDVLSDLRTNCPVAFGKEFGGFRVLTRHADVRRAYAKPAEFLSGQGATLPPLTPPIPAIPVELDGPEHRAFKALIMPWLSGKAVEALRPVMRDLVGDQIDRFIERGECEFISEFAWPLPAAVISTVMGLPKSEWHLVKDMFGVIVAAVQAGEVEKVGAGWAALLGYLGDQLDDRRANPRDDMLTAFTQAVVNGRNATNNEILGLTFTLVTAGQDTTAVAIAMLMHHLAENPTVRDRLVEAPALIPDAIEEVLRWKSPLQTMSRVVAEDLELSDGCPLSKGERVAIMIGSANRDEAVFSNAAAFDLDRDNKAKHLAFGFGSHVCAGMQLARLEMQIVFEELLARLRDIELVRQPQVHLNNGQVFGFDRLLLRFRPGSKRL